MLVDAEEKIKRDERREEKADRKKRKRAHDLLQEGKETRHGERERGRDTRTSPSANKNKKTHTQHENVLRSVFTGQSAHTPKPTSGTGLDSTMGTKVSLGTVGEGSWVILIQDSPWRERISLVISLSTDIHPPCLGPHFLGCCCCLSFFAREF